MVLVTSFLNVSDSQVLIFTSPTLLHLPSFLCSCPFTFSVCSLLFGNWGWVSGMVFLVAFPGLMFYWGLMYWSGISPIFTLLKLIRTMFSEVAETEVWGDFVIHIPNFVFQEHNSLSTLHWSNPLWILSHLILIITPCSRYHYYCHYTSWQDQDTLINLPM